MDYTTRVKIVTVGTGTATITSRAGAGKMVQARLTTAKTEVIVQGPEGDAAKGVLRAAAPGDTVAFTVKGDTGTITITPPTGTPATSTFSLNGNVYQVPPGAAAINGWVFDDMVVIAE